jgi:phosphotransferase system  glucose/maltose/N-acetylglucosamine-specific IIC component
MSSSTGENNGDSASVFKRVTKFGKKYAAAYFLALVAVDMLLTMATMLKAVETSKWGWIKAGLMLFVHRKQLVLVIWKTNTIKCIIAGVLTYPWQLYIEHANRKWQASKRQTVITTSIAMLAVSVLWSMILVGLRRSFFVLGG